MIQLFTELQEKKNVRSNLSALRASLKEATEEQKAQAIEFVRGHEDLVFGFLQEEDAKTRKNAALLLGDPVSYTHLDVYKRQHQTKASSHFVIGLDGEIVQCIPCNEIAYASNNRNSDTIAIECCIPDDTGKFNDSTYQSLIELTTWLIGRYDLGIEDVIRHYDVTGKNCPK